MEETENEGFDAKRSDSGSSSMSRRSSKDESPSTSRAPRPGPMSASSSQTSLGEKKGLSVGPFHFTLPRRKGKNKTVPVDYSLDPSVAQTKPLKKLKRSKSLKNSTSSLLARVSGYVQVAEDDSSSPKSETVPPSPSVDSQKSKFKSKSNLASTLVRKLSSVGKSKKRPIITKREEMSPATSQEEVEPEAEIPSVKTPLLSTDTGVVEEQSHKPLLVEQNQPLLVEQNQPLLVEQNQPLLVEQNQPLLVEQNQPPLVEQNKPLLVEQNQLLSVEQNQSLLVEQNQPLMVKQTQAPSEVPHQAFSEELPIPMELDQIEADSSTAVEVIDKLADQEVHSYSCVDANADVDIDASQSATSVLAEEVSNQSELHEFTGPALEALEVRQLSVAAAAVAGPDCYTNNGEAAAGSSSPSGGGGVDDEATANRYQSHRASEASTTLTSTSSNAAVTFLTRSAWMSQQATSSSGTGSGKGSRKGSGASAKAAKDQILSITGPAWQKQQQEKNLREELGVSSTDASPPVTPTASAGTSAESIQPEVFSTPSGQSPDTESSSSTTLLVDSFSPSSEPVVVSPRADTSEESYSASEAPTEVSFVSAVAPNAEDVMAEARARLSHSLGVAAPGASTQSVQPGSVPGAGGEKREHLYKILVIGELGTGKTSIIKRYVHQFFSQHYRATIGVDFALKVLNWDANTIIRLQLWDIAGQERFGNMTRVYYKEAVAAFIVFDVTRAATFDAVLKWKQDLDSKVQLPDGSPIPCVLLANKCDQQKEGLVNYPAKMDEYCKDRGFAGWFETSAKENVNIEEAARTLVTKILTNDQLAGQADVSKDGDKFNLGEQGTADRAKSKCSC